MDHNFFSTSIRCDDNEMLVFDRCVWDDGYELIQLSIMDCFVSKNEFRGLFGRLRRAWQAFGAKPIYRRRLV